jgi:hypothetical protein
MEFARKLANPAGKPGRALLLFDGAINPDDLGAIAMVLEVGRQQINTDQSKEKCRYF